MLPMLASVMIVAQQPFYFTCEPTRYEGKAPSETRDSDVANGSSDVAVQAESYMKCDDVNPRKAE
jgi:hypothetical protein